MFNYSKNTNLYDDRIRILIKDEIDLLNNQSTGQSVIISIQTLKFYNFGGPQWEDLETNNSYRGFADDKFQSLAKTLSGWLFKYKDIKIVNTSKRFRYFPFCETRRVLCEKTISKKKRKLFKVKSYLCVDDGTLKYYGTDALTENKIYKGREHFSNPKRNVVADKFLYIGNNCGDVEMYPKRLFKEI